MELRARQYANDRFFTLCNYEQVLRDILAIEQVKWDLIILDESQRIKNWEAKTSRVIKGLKSRFALVLTGTPLENRLDDLFSVVEFIDDRRLGPAFHFYNRHRLVDEKGKVLGYKNLDTLRERLKPVLLRRKRQSVMQPLPTRTNANGRKLILFSEWTTMLDLVTPLLEKHGLRFVRLDGQVPQRKRQQLVHEFQQDPSCQAFMTTNAGSTGLNLQAANTVINVDLPWN